MEVLRRLAYMNSMRRVNSIGSGVGNANIPGRRTGGSGNADAATDSRTAVEIHLIPSGGNGGIVVDNSGREVPQPFTSGGGGGGSIHNAGFRVGVPGSAGVTSDESRGGRRGSSDLGNGNFAAPGTLDRTSDSSVGRGAYGSGFAETGNFGIGYSGVGRRSGVNSDLTAGIAGAGINGNAGRNFNDGNNAVASVSGIAATARARTGGRGGSASLVGVAGVRATSRSGFGANDGTGRLTITDPVTVNGGLVRVGGAFTSSGAGVDNYINLGAGTGEASYGGRRRSGVPRMEGVSSAFSGALAVNERTATGRSGRAGANGIAPRNSLFGADSDGEVGLNLGDNELDGPDETTIDDERAVGSRSRGDAGFRG